MAKDRLSDTLAVILHADVEGSTELVHQDKQLAHERIQDSFQRFSNTIEKYHGHVHELRGDALLASFERSSDAVAAALAFQADHTYQNSRLQDDLRPVIRVGISMGEVVIADNTVTGTGVVQAQRVEQLAGPGGVCITAVIHDSLSKRMPFEFVSLGEKELKGFDHAVHVYCVELASGESVPAPIEAGNQNASPGNRRLVAAFVAVILVVVGGTAFWFKSQEPKVEAASIERMAFPLPDKPSIAVLPFVNMSNDAEQEYIVDGMTEDLITDISKISGLFVIARNSVFTYKGKAIKIQQVAEELGVRYVLEGSVRRAGDQVRINAQLIDATTGGHLWAERYDGTIADVFSLQDKITTRIVDALALELTPQEVQRVGNPGTDNVQAYNAYLLGLSFYYRRSPESFAKARTHFEQAIELDTNYTLAYVALAKIYAQVGWTITYTRALSINQGEADAKAQTLMAKVQATPFADVHVVRSWLALNKYQQKRAIVEAERALELDSNNVDAMEALSRAQIYAGRPESGIKLAKSMMRQNPTRLTRPFLLMGLAEFALGNSDMAVEHIERAFELGSEEIRYAGILAAAYGELGRVDQAKKAFQVFQQVEFRPPDLALSMTLFPFSDPSVLERLAKGLELSGVKVWYTIEDGGYMPLDESNKLSGAEIESLLSGNKLEGKGFWGSGPPWGRQQGVDGTVEYSGYRIQPGVPKGAIGTSRVEDDMLCERWPEVPEPLELCSVIFRLPGENARTRWGDYVLITDTGPNRFKVVQ
jgi:TolB-like protein/class 3 adenylate cyclase/Flp pilus assembly protein TadD